MPVSLSEWRVRIGTFNPKPRDPANQKKEDRKGEKYTKQEQDRRRRCQGNTVILILLLIFCLLNVNVNWLPHDNTEGKDGHPTQHMSCQQGTFVSADNGSQADSIGKQNQTLSSDLSSTFLVSSSGSAVCPQGQDLVTLPSPTPSTQKHVGKKTMYLSSVVSGCLDVGSSFLRGLWKLLISKLHLMRAGDIENNPGPKSKTKTNGSSHVHDSNIQDKELLQLANKINPSKHLDIGIELGFGNAELDHIKVSHLPNMRDALMEVFKRWKLRQEGGNEREILAEALRKAELDDLARKLLQGQLVVRGSSRSGVSLAAMQGAQDDQPSGSRSFSSLSEEQFAECCADIKTFYRTSLCKIREDPLDPTSLRQFDDLFTNLKLLTEDGRHWQDLDYNELFNMKVNGEPPKRLMVQGEAGVGKTTLCAKIAWDWINGTNFQQFKLVLIVPLRESENFTVGEIVKSLLMTGRSVHPRQLDEYIIANQASVLIIFDGLDEFKKEISISSNNQTQSRRGIQQETGIDIVKTLSSRELEMAVVMVTTRPWKAHQIRWNTKLRKVYTFIGVEGFTKDNVSVYIKKSFKNDETKAMNLIQFTGENDIIAENIAPFPIYTSMLCLMWRELKEERCRKIEQFQTFSQLFKEMFMFLKEHFILKTNENINDPSRVKILTEINEHLKFVAFIAFNGLLERNMIFKENAFQPCYDAMETACKIGVLTREKKLLPRIQWHDSTESPLQSIVSFPHKLFQEFVAGMLLDVLYHSNREKYIRVIEEVVLPRMRELRYLLYFGTAQSKEVGMDIMLRMSKGCRSERDFIVDVAFECHCPIAAERVRSRVLPHMTSLTINNDKTAHTLVGYMFLQPNLTELIVQQRDCQLSLSTGIAETICQTTTLKKVTFDSCKMKDVSFAILAKKGRRSKVQTLILREMGLSDLASRDLSTWLCGLSDLTHLELSGMDLNDSCYERLARAPPLKVQSLTLLGMPLGDSASRDLLTWLCGLSDLTQLKLNRMRLSDSFYERLAKAPLLKGQSLKLHWMDLSESASRDLSTWMFGLINLTHLELCGMRFNDSFYETLARAPPLKVQSLTLHCMNMSDSASRDLSTWLCGLSDLTNLKLIGMGHNDSFYERLARAPPLKVQFVILHVMDLSDSASRDLSTWLCGLSDLTHLELNRMHLKDSFYEGLARAPPLKVQSLTLDSMNLSNAASRDLSAWLCELSDLTDLNLVGIGLTDSFYGSLAKAPPLKNCFCQMSQGSFKFNGVSYSDIDTFLQAVRSNSKTSDEKKRPVQSASPCHQGLSGRLQSQERSMPSSLVQLTLPDIQRSIQALPTYPQEYAAGYSSPSLQGIPDSQRQMMPTSFAQPPMQGTQSSLQSSNAYPHRHLPQHSSVSAHQAMALGMPYQGHGSTHSHPAVHGMQSSSSHDTGSSGTLSSAPATSSHMLSAEQPQPLNANSQEISFTSCSLIIRCLVACWRYLVSCSRHR